MLSDESITGNDNNQLLYTNKALYKEALEKIEANLFKTLLFGGIAGVGGITGYSLCLKDGSIKFLFLTILLAAASYVSGFFLGFLFGIPKRNIDKESPYNLSTNLVDISDWLTKIIIGLGLIEIKQIPVYLQHVGIYIQQSVNGDPSVKIFSVCCIVYFSVFGLYYGYNYMRLFLSSQFKDADNNLLENQKMLLKTGEELNNQDFAPDNLDTDMKKKVKDYEQLLKKTKTESSYTFEDWYYKGIAAYEKNEYNKTIAYMRSALDKDKTAKNAPDAYLYIGLAYDKLDLDDKAIEATTQLINTYKDYQFLYLAHSNNGIYYERLKQYDKAMEHFDQATKLKPDDAQTWYSKAVIYAIKNKKDNMLDSLKNAIQYNSGYKLTAKSEAAFDQFKNDEKFKKLVEETT